MLRTPDFGDIDWPKIAFWLVLVIVLLAFWAVVVMLLMQFFG